jgi:hypothetical protein
MINTIMQLIGRPDGRKAEPIGHQPAAIEQLEGRLLMSATSVTDGTSNTILFGEAYHRGPYVNASSYQVISAGGN